MKRIIASFIVLFLVSTVLYATDAKKFVGKWTGSKENAYGLSLGINIDGSCSLTNGMQANKGNWQINNDGSATMRFNDSDKEFLRLNLSGDKLKMTVIRRLPSGETLDARSIHFYKASDTLSADADNERIANYVKAKQPLPVQKKEPIDVAKAFVKALIDEDKETVEKLLGYNEKNIYFIYSDASRRNMAKQHYKTMTRWEQKYHNRSYATVKAYGKESGGFEVNKTNGIWYIRAFY